MIDLMNKTASHIRNRDVNSVYQIFNYLKKEKNYNFIKENISERKKSSQIPLVFIKFKIKKKSHLGQFSRRILRMQLKKNK